MPGRIGKGALLVAGCFLFAPAEGSQGVSRTPPPEYHEHLEARLSRAALPGDEAASSSADGIVLLDEEVQYVESSGRVVAAVHRQIKPLSRAGVQRANRIAIPFRPGTEAAHLVLARRIQPDGTAVSVRDDAVLRETPQLLDDHESYADLAEIVILFPGTAPGDLIEYVVVKEIEPLIPGEFKLFLPVADTWPQLRSRRQILLPRDMALRLRSKPLGLGELRPQPTASGDGLTVLTWEFRGLEAARMERKREPIRQAGPGIWLSTIDDWSDIGMWYLKLLEGADSVDEELERLARQWRSPARDPIELARALTTHVSEQVEYLGLALGMGSFRPKPANLVWKSRFGDCKDQANLLRVLLGVLGVPSYLALVNTQHAGLIEKEIPDYRQFNHVLLAVPGDDGRYVFFDPTVPSFMEGRLPPSALGREALVIRPEGSEFVGIPAGSAGDLDLAFDLRVTPLGQLHGRLRIQGRGFQGALLVDSLAGQGDGSPDEMLENFLQHFLPGSQVMEVEDVAGRDRGDDQLLEAYFWVPEANASQKVPLTVPFADLLLPELGERKRQTRYYQPQGTVHVLARYHLPDGSHTTADPPPAMRASATAVMTRAEWKRTEDGLEGDITHESRVNLLDQAAFAALYDTRDRLREWQAEPVVVHLDECSFEEGLEASLADLPCLKTAAGQLHLVNALFPEMVDSKRRRAALIKVTDWFPDDQAAVFDARVEIAVIDQRHGRAEASIEEIRDLLERYGQQVDEESRAWAEYLLADGLRLTGRIEEAREIYDRLAQQESLSANRRGWSYARAAFLRRTSSPLEALAILEEGAQLDSAALPQQVVLLVELLSVAAPLEVINISLDRICRRHPHRILEIHERLADEITDYLDEGETGRAGRFADLLVSRIDSNPDLSFLAERATRLRRLVSESVGCREIAARIEAYFSSNSPAWWSEKDSAIGTTDRDTMIAALERMDKTGQSREFVRTSVEVVTRFNIAPDFFGFLLFRCAGHLHAAECDPDLLDRFLGWCEQLPETNRFRSAAAMMRQSIEEESVHSGAKN